MTTALEGGEGSASGPGRSLPPGKTRYPLYRRLGGHQSRSGQVRKISPLTGNRSPDRPTRSQSLYRLGYPAQLTALKLWINFATQVQRRQFYLQTVSKLLRNSPAFMEVEGTLSQTPDPATRCHNQPHDCSPRSHTLIPTD